MKSMLCYVYDFRNFPQLTFLVGRILPGYRSLHVIRLDDMPTEY